MVEISSYLRWEPSRLRQLALAHSGKDVVIDEVQKVPLLLDEVHWLIENNQNRFVLCGSSARKVRRGHATCTPIIFLNLPALPQKHRSTERDYLMSLTIDRT